MLRLRFIQATDDVQKGITDEDYELFYETWREFDPEGTQYIPYETLSEFLDVLEQPLQIPRPNKFKIIQMDVPIVQVEKDGHVSGRPLKPFFLPHITFLSLHSQFTNPETGKVMEDCVFCADILDILTQDFFARKNNSSFNSPHVEDVKVSGRPD